MIFVDRIERKYAFILAAARRARQLQAGAPPLVPPGLRKPTRIAMEEVISGSVPYDLPPMPGEEEEEEVPSGRKKK